MARADNAHAEQSSLYSLPGLTLPLNHHPPTKIPPHHRRPRGYKPPPEPPLFPNALHVQDLADGYNILPLKTVRELAMLQLMGHITDKRAWEKKVLKDTIVAKWRDEIQNTDRDISLPMLDWVIAELHDKAAFYTKTGGIVIAYEFGIVKSDLAVPEATRLALSDAARVLEETTIPADYHPGSDGKVVNLVHPSLFPLVYGRSRVLRDRTLVLEECLDGVPPGQQGGEVIPVPALEEAQLPPAEPEYINYSTVKNIPSPYSRKFQWLPCDVQLVWPSSCRITSYINNLHPEQHAGLYTIIEDIIACAIPLWNWTLGPLDGENARNLDDGSDLFSGWPPNRVIYRDVEYCHEEPQHGPRFVAEEVVQPEPLEYKPWDTPYLDLRLHCNSLQVIVKLANIELTPEKPGYEGGSWHVEGQLNEHICVTALYYYSCENITSSRLSFRQESSWDIPHYTPNQIDPWLSTIYGGQDHGPRVQEIIDIECRQGRLLTFPNVFQHRVQPFSLRDRSRPGHRKILALFLVDPNITVISTGSVAPQREDWLGDGDGQAGINMMSMAEAKELRLELMEERKVFAGDQDAAFQSLRFNLCEH